MSHLMAGQMSELERLRLQLSVKASRMSSISLSAAAAGGLKCQDPVSGSSSTTSPPGLVSPMYVVSCSSPRPRGAIWKRAWVRSILRTGGPRNRQCLGGWPGIGRAVTGMARQQYDLQLTGLDQDGWCELRDNRVLGSGREAPTGGLSCPNGSSR